MDEDNYSSQTDMLSDSSKRKNNSKIQKQTSSYQRMFKKVPETEFGSIMGNLTFGMLIIFPIIAILTKAYPIAVFLIILLIFLLTLIFSRSIKFSLIILGVSIAPVILGFISLGFYIALLT